jgi:FlaA1/EpsC-like NDP-sugar epimerase
MNRSVVYVLCDLGFIAISYLGAWFIRSEGEMSRSAVVGFLTYLPLFATVQIACFMFTGLYRRSYRYAGVADLVVVCKSLVVAIVAGWAALSIAHHFQRPAISFTVLDAYILTTLVLGSRLSFRLLDYSFNASRKGARRALIYGAGKGGVAALQEMRFNPAIGMTAVGFLDDDATKWGHIVQGLPVHSPEGLEKFIDERRMDTIVVSTRKIPQERIADIRCRCGLAGISLRMLHIRMDEIAPEREVSMESAGLDTVVSTVGD